MPELILPTLVLILTAIFWLLCCLERRLNDVPVEAPLELTEDEVNRAWEQLVARLRTDDPYDVERDGL